MLVLIAWVIIELIDFVTVVGYYHYKSIRKSSEDCRMVDTQRCFSTNHHQCFTVTKNECSPISQSDCYVQNVRECSTSYEARTIPSCQFSFSNSCSPSYDQDEYKIYSAYMHIDKAYGSNISRENTFPSKNSTCNMLPKYECNLIAHQTPKTSCKYVPRQYCNTQPKSQCKPVYKQQCISVPSTKCVSVPVKECKSSLQDAASIENGNKNVGVLKHYTSSKFRLCFNL